MDRIITGPEQPASSDQTDLPLDPTQLDLLTQLPEQETQAEIPQILGDPLSDQLPEDQDQAPAWNLAGVDLAEVLEQGPIPFEELGESLPGVTDLPDRAKQDMLDRWRQKGLNQKPEWFPGRMKDWREELDLRLEQVSEPDLREVISLSSRNLEPGRELTPQSLMSNSIEQRARQLRVLEVILDMYLEALS